jgi:hypothetical protein
MILGGVANCGSAACPALGAEAAVLGVEEAGLAAAGRAGPQPAFKMTSEVSAVAAAQALTNEPIGR